MGFNLRKKGSDSVSPRFGIGIAMQARRDNGGAALRE
jgi:hypothetical protein